MSANAEVEVDARLDGLGFGYALQDDGREGALGREQHEVLVEQPGLCVAEGFGPEVGEAFLGRRSR